MNAQRVALVRAIVGGAFVALGLGIAAKLLLRPEPFNQKLLGLGFALVLAALGVVRLRASLAVMRGDPR